MPQESIPLDSPSLHIWFLAPSLHSAVLACSFKLIKLKQDFNGEITITNSQDMSKVLFKCVFFFCFLTDLVSSKIHVVGPGDGNQARPTHRRGGQRKRPTQEFYTPPVEPAANKG